MKLYNRVQVMDDGELRLRFNERLASAIGIEEGVTLHGLALERKGDKDLNQDQPELIPTLVLILSPFPIASWGNLLRASLTVPPRPGSMCHALSTLQQDHIYCRHFESTNGADLNNFKLYQSHAEIVDPDCDTLDLIIPTADITLEIPPNITSLDGATETKLLHRSLRGVIDRPDDADIEKEAREMLSRRLGPEITVDWVSSLRTLNRLGQVNFAENESVPESEGIIKAMQARSERSRIRKTFAVEVGQSKDELNPFSITVTPWAEPIWQRRNTIPDIIPARLGEKRLALGYADAGEKLIAWDIFEPRQAVLVALNMLIPSDGYEHVWWHWGLQKIREADGNLLTFHTLARLDGDWGTLEAVILFPLEKDGKDNRRAILTCFRELQGREGGQPSFDQFTERLAELFQSNQAPHKILEPRHLQRSPAPRLESTLHFHSMWDLRGHLKEGDSYKLSSHPFSFAGSLSESEYRKLYSVDYWEQSHSKKVADNISRRLCNGENTLIVGAHRSGKTTLLRLIQSTLNNKQNGLKDQGSTDARRHARAILIPSGTTMPFRILPTVITRLEAWSKEEASPLSKAKDFFRRAGKAIRRPKNRKISKVSGAIGGKFVVNAKAELELTVSELAQIQERIQAVDVLGVEERAKHLVWKDGTVQDIKIKQLIADSMLALEKILSYSAAMIEATIVLVVVIDEFDRFSKEGSKAFVRAWRYAIEDVGRNIDDSENPHVGKLVWLVSSSRSAEESTRLQPMSGMFREWVLEPLGVADCEQLLDQFTGVKRLPDEQGDSYKYVQRHKDRPVLTFLARGFLKKITARLPYFLQVFLVHLYEQAEGQVLPVVNRRVCENILFENVLPELTDYLTAQWAEVTKDVKEEIDRSLQKCPKDPHEFIRTFGAEITRAYPRAPSRYRREAKEKPEIVLRTEPDRFSTRARKMVQRLGLSGGDELILAPLVAVWLLEHKI